MEVDVPILFIQGSDQLLNGILSIFKIIQCIGTGNRLIIIYWVTNNNHFFWRAILLDERSESNNIKRAKKSDYWSPDT